MFLQFLNDFVDRSSVALYLSQQLTEFRLLENISNISVDAGADGLQPGQQRLGAEGGERIAPLEMEQVLGNVGHAGLPRSGKPGILRGQVR